MKWGYPYLKNLSGCGNVSPGNTRTFHSVLRSCRLYSFRHFVLSQIISSKWPLDYGNQIFKTACSLLFGISTYTNVMILIIYAPFYYRVKYYVQSAPMEGGGDSDKNECLAMVCSGWDRFYKRVSDTFSNQGTAGSLYAGSLYATTWTAEQGDLAPQYLENLFSPPSQPKNCFSFNWSLNQTSKWLALIQLHKLTVNVSIYVL